MFKFLKKKQPKEGTPAFRRMMAQKIAGKHIKYVTERFGNEELVIGKEGSLTLRGDEFIVFASSDILFRANVDELNASELMSLDGVILTAPDLEHGGQLRSIVAYYLYYR